MAKKLMSRKLWVAVLTILGISFGQDYMSETNADYIVGAISVAYLVGQGFVDAFKR